MRYDGGARQLLPDGSIEIYGRRRYWILGVVLLAVVPGMLLTSQWPNLSPALIAIGYVAWRMFSRRRARRVLFDASARELHILTRGWNGGDQVIAFSDIQAIAVEHESPDESPTRRQY